MNIHGKSLTSSFFFLLLPCLIIVFGLGILNDADCNDSELLTTAAVSDTLVQCPFERRGRIGESETRHRTEII